MEGLRVTGTHYGSPAVRARVVEWSGLLETGFRAADHVAHSMVEVQVQSPWVLSPMPQMLHGCSSFCSENFQTKIPSEAFPPQPFAAQGLLS
ncbi:Wd Repeat-Containing Protein 72 [Manis pentadactyla]|nr:Wd Repeat-Containing Protein 72 [Manis pentadactyla]